MNRPATTKWDWDTEPTADLKGSLNARGQDDWGPRFILPMPDGRWLVVYTRIAGYVASKERDP